MIRLELVTFIFTGILTVEPFSTSPLKALAMGLSKISCSPK